MKYSNIVFIISIFLIGCRSNITYNIKSYEEKVIETQYEKDSAILSIITPYKLQIENKMNEVISYTKTELNKKGTETTIGNFVTDLCLKYVSADLCLMNKGGLRTVISEGPITVGKVYELMPFENELVVVEIDSTEFNGLLEYITKRGGEPFSGISIIMNDKNELISHTNPIDFREQKSIKVLTSDYLANGGDKMWFFKEKKQYKTGLKLRNVIIDYCRETDTIIVKKDGRIKILDYDK